MPPIFTFRTKMGQEKALARLSQVKGGKADSGVYAILIPDTLKGYCFIEGEDQLKIENTVSQIKVISGRAVGNREVPIEELGDFLNPKPSIEGLETGDIVEIIDGPFKGLRAKLTRIEDTSQEVTAELLDSTMALPVRIHADYVKRIRTKDEDAEQSSFGKFSL
ncbi:MAG: transcription elongation factor Spt5 [Candidatus Heimdallarchaeota archaeon]|nr:transcription elongation factor Spt5 [Candidatus Heimdallarchaeota archaeon]